MGTKFLFAIVSQALANSAEEITLEPRLYHYLLIIVTLKRIFVCKQTGETGDFQRMILVMFGFKLPQTIYMEQKLEGK
jgi:hypothetical protein